MSKKKKSKTTAHAKMQELRKWLEKEIKEHEEHLEKLPYVPKGTEDYDRVMAYIGEMGMAKTIFKDFFIDKSVTNPDTVKSLSRHCRLTLDEAFDLIHSTWDGSGNTKKNILLSEDVLVGTSSQRYQVFSNSVNCVSCDHEGSFFGVERHAGDTKYHMNLYAMDVDGREVLMTKDHIKAKANGGKNSLDNYQTMCEICNREKGSKE